MAVGGCGVEAVMAVVVGCCHVIGECESESMKVLRKWCGAPVTGCVQVYSQDKA
jgi:hypothetical protein